MNRSHLMTGLLTLSAVATLVFALMAPDWIGRGFNWGLITFVIAMLAIAAFFFEFESRQISSREVALIAMMGTLSAIIRIPFAPIPNVQPATFIIICTGYVFGPMAGFMTGAITALVSNLFLGHGPWTLFQILGWGMAGFVAGLFRSRKLNIWMLAVFGVIWGYVFGVIMNLWFWASLIYPLTWQTFLISQANSLWFDTMHALANGAFMLLVGRKTITIMQNWHRRFFWKKLAGGTAS